MYCVCDQFLIMAYPFVQLLGTNSVLVHFFHYFSHPVGNGICCVTL
jgi:hypothetical protein